MFQKTKSVETFSSMTNDFGKGVCFLIRFSFKHLFRYRQRSRPFFVPPSDLRKDKPSPFPQHGDAVPRVQFPRCPRTDSAVDKYPFRFKIRRRRPFGKDEIQPPRHSQREGKIQTKFHCFFPSPRTPSFPLSRRTRPYVGPVSNFPR